MPHLARSPDASLSRHGSQLSRESWCRQPLGVIRSEASAARQWEEVWTEKGWAQDLRIESGGHVAATQTQKARMTWQQPCGHTGYSAPQHTPFLLAQAGAGGS